MKAYREARRADPQYPVKRGNNSGAAGRWQVTLRRVGIAMVLRHGPGLSAYMRGASRAAALSAVILPAQSEILIEQNSLHQFALPNARGFAPQPHRRVAQRRA